MCYDPKDGVADEAGPNGKWCEEATLDAMTKFGLSCHKVDDLVHFFQRCPSTGSSCRMGLDTSLQPTQTQPSQVLLQPENSCERDAAIQSSMEADMSSKHESTEGVPKESSSCSLRVVQAEGDADFGSVTWAGTAYNWFYMLDQVARDDLQRFFADAAGHYGKWCEEATLDAMTKFSLSRHKVDDLVHLFQTFPSTGGSCRMGADTSSQPTQAQPSQVLLQLENSSETDAAIQSSIEVDMSSQQVQTQSAQATLQTSSGSLAECAHRLFRTELSYQPQFNFMEQQRDINGRMRAILVDWLVEVHLKYRAGVETLFLSVNIIDRFLSKRTVRRNVLQLIGVSAFWLASKFLEAHPPKISDLIYYCDNAYTRDDVLNAEVRILNVLNFRIHGPTTAHFLDILCRISQCDALYRNLTQYIAELALLDLGMIRYSPSHLASASLLLSNHLLAKEPIWSESIAQVARHTQHDLASCMGELLILLRAAPSARLGAIRSKFLRAETMQVATLRF